MIDKYAHLLKDPWFRITHLYKIVDKDRRLLDFKPNSIQRRMYDGRHSRNVVLKARQLGSSTFWSIFLLDQVLFNDNYRAGIIGYSLKNAASLFRIVRTAYQHLPKEIKEAAPLKRENTQELEFAHGSSVHVSTTMRGGTLDGLLCSELGRTAAHFPAKAEEVVTGCLNTLSPSAFAVFESTAEGAQGEFYNLCKTAYTFDNPKALSSIDWRFHFFGWQELSDYADDDPHYTIPKEDEAYFATLLSSYSIDLTHRQKVWYSKMHSVLGDKMRAEFPTLPDEAFWKNADAFYYLGNLAKAKDNGQITAVPWQSHLPVYTAWDFGVTMCCIIFFQRLPSGIINIIDFYEDSRPDITFYLNETNKKPYNYGTHFLPHDAKSEQGTSGKCYQDYFTELRMPTEVIPRESVEKGIMRTKTTFPRIYFDEKKTELLREHIQSYRRRWNASMAMYMDDPVGDQHSHSADALRYVCSAAAILQGSPDVEALKDIQRWGATEHLRRW